MSISKILVANRSEIAIRVFRAANELGIKTVAIWAEEDKLALHRFKADESYRVGRGPHLDRDLGPIESYLSIDEVLRVARLSGADAIHPGYGLLSESPEFADACAEAGIIFIGPKPETMRRLGNKVAARNLAVEIGVPVVPATEPLPDDMDDVARMAAEIGYPLMLKASWGGGGRGMRAIRKPEDLAREVTEAKREAKAAFGKDEVYLEKLVERARHVEVQVLGDTHGNVVDLFERDCSIQRRNQKVVERAPAPYLDEAQRAGTVRPCTPDRRGDRLCRGRNRRIPDGCRYRQILLHRGQSAHPGRAHRHRGGDRHRHRQGADPHPRRTRHRHAGIGRAGAVRTSSSTATRCSAASRPRIRSRTSFPTTAASPPIAAPPASASGSTAARPIPAR